MGCWNGSCAITNLPVFYGDEVFVFFLEEYGFTDRPSYCYPSNNWILLPLHFQGEYNDYGSVENCSGLMLEPLVKAIQQELHEMEQGENQFHDIAVKKDGLTIEKIFEADHEGRLFVKCQQFEGMKTKLRLKHIFIKSEVLINILNEYKIERYIWNQSGTKLSSFEDYYEDAMAYYAKVVRLKQENPKSLFFLRFENDEPGSWFKQSLEGGESYPQTLDAKILVSELSFTETPDNVAKELLRQVCVYKWLEWMMLDARRSWAPPSGSGSQNDSTFAQQMLAKITIDLGKQIDNRWEEEDE